MAPPVKRESARRPASVAASTSLDQRGPAKRPGPRYNRTTADLFANFLQSQRQVLSSAEDLVAGDYTLRVTVIEALGLAARDATGTSDPYVVAFVGASRQRTHVHRHCLSCTWDTTMAFELPGLTPQRAELLSIRFEVRDADTLSSELIGTCELEVVHVWQSPNHAVWHTWMALFSAEEENARGLGRMTRGYLRVSALLIGPGRQKSLPLEPPREAEVRGVLLSPSIKMTFGTLFLDVLRAVGVRPLTPLKPGQLGANQTARQPQLRVSVVLRFAGLEVRTQANRVDFSNDLSEVAFEQRLRMPLSLPAIADRIELLLVDDTSRAVLASAVVSLATTERRVREFKFLPMYGAAIGSKQAVADAIARGELPPTAWRGSIQCRLHRKLTGDADIRRAIGGGHFGAVEGLRVNGSVPEAERVRFALLVRVFSATGLPVGGPFSIAVQLAHAESETRAAMPLAARAVEWNQPLALTAELPTERSAQPDVFITLRGPLKQLLAFARVPVSELGQMPPDQGGGDLAFVRPRPHWLTLSRADAGGGLSEAGAAGGETVELLLETHFGRENPRAGPFQAGPPERPPVLMAAKLKLLLLAADGLPAADEGSNGNRFVVFRCGGCETTARSAARPQTSCPGWYEVLTLQLPLPVDRLLWPTATLEVWVSKGTLGTEVMVGSARIQTSAAAARVQPRSTAARHALEPCWYALEPPAGGADAPSGLPLAPPAPGRSRLDDAPRSALGAVLAACAVEEAASAAFFYAQANESDEAKRLRFGDRTAVSEHAGGLASLGAEVQKLGRGLGMGLSWLDAVPRTVRQAEPLELPRAPCCLDILLVGLRLNPTAKSLALLRQRARADLELEFELQVAFGTPVRAHCRLPLGGLSSDHVRLQLPCELPLDPTLCPSVTVRLRDVGVAGALGVQGSGAVLATGALPLRAPLAAAMSSYAGAAGRLALQEAAAARGSRAEREKAAADATTAAAAAAAAARRQRKGKEGVEATLRAMGDLQLRALPHAVEAIATAAARKARRSRRRARPSQAASAGSTPAASSGDEAASSDSSDDGMAASAPPPPPRNVPPSARKVERMGGSARGRSPFRLLGMPAPRARSEGAADRTPLGAPPRARSPLRERAWAGMRVRRQGQRARSASPERVRRRTLASTAVVAMSVEKGAVGAAPSSVDAGLAARGSRAWGWPRSRRRASSEPRALPSASLGADLGKGVGGSGSSNKMPSVRKQLSIRKVPLPGALNRARTAAPSAMQPARGRVFWEGDLESANELPGGRRSLLRFRRDRRGGKDELARKLPSEAAAASSGLLAADGGRQLVRRQTQRRPSQRTADFDSIGEKGPRGGSAAEAGARRSRWWLLRGVSSTVGKGRRRKSAAKGGEEEEDDEDDEDDADGDGQNTTIVSATGDLGNDDEDDALTYGRHLHPTELEEMVVAHTSARLIKPPYSSRPLVVRIGGGLHTIGSIKYALAVNVAPPEPQPLSPAASDASASGGRKAAQADGKGGVSKAEGSAADDGRSAEHSGGGGVLVEAGHERHSLRDAGASADGGGARGTLGVPRVWRIHLLHTHGLANIDASARVFIRVYVLRGHQLSRTRTASQLRGGLSALGIGAASHVSWLSGEAAPTGLSTYLSVSHGGTVQSDRLRAVKGTFEPQYYHSFEFEAKMPGDGRVRISVIEAGAVPLLDEELGSTEIDVEDRWFSKAWVDAKPKVPLEKRVLYRETSSAAQGSLDLWVEVLSWQEWKATPYKEIALAPPEEFELRLIIFETKRLRKSGTIRAMDPYFRCRLVGHGGPMQSQETDVHWGVIDGMGLFNWRFIFKLTLPLSSRRSLQGLHIDMQVWDHALIGEGEVIATARIDVSRLCKNAWLEREDLKQHDRTLPLEPKGVGSQRFWVDMASSANEERATSAGEVAISLEAMPAEVAKKRPAGQGRDPPNRYPVLPEPRRSRTNSGFSERFTSIMRDEMRISMADSVKAVIDSEIQRQQRQLTPERLRLAQCGAGCAACVFISVILFQVVANVIICIVVAQNAAVFDQALGGFTGATPAPT